METIITPHSLFIQTDDTGAVVSIQRQSKKAIFDGDQRLTPWELCDPEDMPFPLDETVLGEVNAGLLAQIATLKAKLAAANQPPAPDTSARALARVALREQWDSLPAWIRGPYQHQFAAANALLDAGQDDAAAALIQYADVPTAFDLEQIEVFSRVRDEMLAALEALPA
jgi:hypothetical protein